MFTAGLEVLTDRVSNAAYAVLHYAGRPCCAPIHSACSSCMVAGLAWSHQIYQVISGAFVPRGFNRGPPNGVLWHRQGSATALSMRNLLLFAVFLLSCSSAAGADKKIVAYAPTWTACPTPTMLRQYTHAMVAFVVTYPGVDTNYHMHIHTCHSAHVHADSCSCLFFFAFTQRTASGLTTAPATNPARSKQRRDVAARR